MNLADKHVLLTGATGGIGSVLARLLAVRGAGLLLTARSADRLSALQNELASTGAQVEIVAADLAMAAGRERIVTAAVRFGIDVLINNAGAGYFGLYAEQSSASVDTILATNALAPLLLTRELLPFLCRSGNGAIVNVGSALGSIGMPGQAVYAASKFALHGFSEALRRELAGTGVRVLYVAPRTTDTSMNGPFARAVSARMGNRCDDPETVASQLVAALLAGEQERFIGWPERLAIKLNALLPGMIDRMLSKQSRLIREADQTDGIRILTQGARQ